MPEKFHFTRQCNTDDTVHYVHVQTRACACVRALLMRIIRVRVQFHFATDFERLITVWGQYRFIIRLGRRRRFPFEGQTVLVLIVHRRLDRRPDRVNFAWPKFRSSTPFSPFCVACSDPVFFFLFYTLSAGRGDKRRVPQ